MIMISLSARGRGPAPEPHLHGVPLGLVSAGQYILATAAAATVSTPTVAAAAVARIYCQLVPRHTINVTSRSERAAAQDACHSDSSQN